MKWTVSLQPLASASAVSCNGPVGEVETKFLQGSQDRPITQRVPASATPQRGEALGCPGHRRGPRGTHGTGFTGVIPGAVGIAAGAVGVVLVATGAVGFCPLYAALGMNTCPRD